MDRGDMEQNTPFVRALLRDDWPAFQAHLAELERQGDGTPVAITGFAFAIAVRRQFGERKDLSEIIRFVADTRARLLVGDDLPVRESEALVCATLDIDEPCVEETVDNLEVGRLAFYGSRLLGSLIAQANMSDAEIDALLAEAERQIAAWSDD